MCTARVTELYGEHDEQSIVAQLAMFAAHRHGRCPLIGDRGGVLQVRRRCHACTCVQMTYAGNAAAGIVALLSSMRADDATGDEHRRQRLNGEAFLMLDDTPKQSIFNLAEHLFQMNDDYIESPKVTRTNRTYANASCDSGFGV